MPLRCSPTNTTNFHWTNFPPPPSPLTPPAFFLAYQAGLLNAPTELARLVIAYDYYYYGRQMAAERRRQQDRITRERQQHGQATNWIRQSEPPPEPEVMIDLTRDDELGGDAGQVSDNNDDNDDDGWEEVRYDQVNQSPSRSKIAQRVTDNAYQGLVDSIYRPRP